VSAIGADSTPIGGRSVGCRSRGPSRYMYREHRLVTRRQGPAAEGGNAVKAVVLGEFHGPEQLRLTEVADPGPGEAQRALVAALTPPLAGRKVRWRSPAERRDRRVVAGYVRRQWPGAGRGISAGRAARRHERDRSGRARRGHGRAGQGQLLPGGSA